MKDWLKDCESKWNIDILFACEAGSRAWGTDSTESDRDLRFIYRHRDIRSYLSLKKPSEVIDYQNPIDAHGWDIFKAFQLASKSNPSLYEWVFSPMIYEDKNGFSIRLKEIIIENYSSFAVAMHYLSLITRNLKEVSGKETLGKKQQKQLIQIVRAILVIHEILANGRVTSSPYFRFEEKPSGIWEYYYSLLVNAKKEDALLKGKRMSEIIVECDKEKQVLESRCQELSKGEAFKEKLDQWLWEILGI
jgi:uncharacterized protein